MTEFSEVDKSKISAETARKNKASKEPIEKLIERVDNQDGVGLWPSEVLALRFEIERLSKYINALNQIG